MVGAVCLMLNTFPRIDGKKFVLFYFITGAFFLFCLYQETLARLMIQKLILFFTNVKNKFQYRNRILSTITEKLYLSYHYSRVDGSNKGFEIAICFTIIIFCCCAYTRQLFIYLCMNIPPALNNLVQ